MTDRFPPLSADPAFFEAMLARFHADPAAVDADWRDLFVALGEQPGRPLPVNGAGASKTVSLPPGRLESGDVRLAAGAMSLAGAYRARGHLAADWDPLRLSNAATHPDLDPASHGIEPGDMDRPTPWVTGPADATPRRLAGHFHRIYCGTLSVEFMHLDDSAPRQWMQDAMEGGFGLPPAAARCQALDRIVEAETFETFMQVKFPGAKRFGMEGSESQLPLAERLLEQAAATGIDEVVVGPMHRGRTTFMATFMGKPLAAIFSEFMGRPWYVEDPRIAGDVTYHMGHSGTRDVGDTQVHLSMASHPSHVEAIIPVSMGILRARQAARGPEARQHTLGLMMHTDAGFAGQGVSYEALQLARLPNYETGGSIHVIANNQVGFTTNPEDARSSTWCSDPAKLIQAPVLRVNGDDPDAAIRAADIAVAFNRRFGRDVLIDLACYRRRGHNELDEPRFTQPAAYAAVDALQTVREIYAERLASEGLIEDDTLDAMAARHRARFEAAFEGADTWEPVSLPDEAVTQHTETGVAADRLHTIARSLAEAPDGFTIHPKLLGQLEDRRDGVLSGDAVTWPAAEALAIGSLLQEGTPVRLSGQDTRRGTFSHRHGVLFDRTTGAAHIPLSTLGAPLEIFDTPLSEEATLAFEYGYASASPETLVLWEAQFGDFINGAQIVVDQFLAAGETKWLTTSGPVLLLPHGLEGGGPEHSSARLERFLQLAAGNNIEIAQPTDPANFFHVLRRHMTRGAARPLVILTPKQMLRHKRAISPIAEFLPGTAFRPVLSERSESKPSTTVLCTGRIYYDLIERREQTARDDVALVRIEQVYPFPADDIARALSTGGNDIVWCQEEPANMGAWAWIAPRLEKLLGPDLSLRYAGRPESPSPADGFKSRHEAAQARVIDAVFAQ